MTTVYTLEKGKHALGMAQAVKTYLRMEKGMNVYMLELANGEMVVQGRQCTGRIRQVMGLERTITVKLIPIGTQNVAVETAQGRLAKRILQEIRRYLTTVEIGGKYGY